MAKKDKVKDADPDELPDGTASVILRGGPYDGALDALPEGSEVFRNEVLIPSPGAMNVYQRKKPEGGLPAYRFVRAEPVYKTED